MGSIERLFSRFYIFFILKSRGEILEDSRKKRTETSSSPLKLLMKTILAVFYNALEELSDEVEFSTHQSLQII